MLTWNELLDIELRNKGNEDVVRLLAALRETQDMADYLEGEVKNWQAHAGTMCATCPGRDEG